MRLATRLAVGGAVGIAVLLAAAVAGVEARWTRTFDAPYPAIGATSDPALIENGRYLAYGPGACAYCHVPKSDWAALDRGENLPLSGAHAFPLPFGTFYSPNLTPDRETGIGRRSDGELARMLRHGVRADGRAPMPLMEYQAMSDEDLTAILSFLRSQPPVYREVPDHQLDFIGRAIFAFVIRPTTDRAAPRITPRGATVVRGEYLANNVAVCVACHTNRSAADGSFTGPKFAGGLKMDYAADPTKVQAPPNLTPDARTGRITQWSEQDFVDRFRRGATFGESIMPWGAYRRMTGEDLRAIYRYLRTLPAVQNDTGAYIQEK
jgi:mono/diheme cytochrome c family protein